MTLGNLEAGLISVHLQSKGGLDESWQGLIIFHVFYLYLKQIFIYSFTAAWNFFAGVFVCPVCFNWQVFG